MRKPPPYTEGQITVKRSWTVLATIFLSLSVPLGITLAVARMELVAASVIAALAGAAGALAFFFTLFPRPILVVRPDGIWTRHLDFASWDQVKEVRIKRTRTYKNPVATVELVIETTDGYKDVFDSFFMNLDAESLMISIQQWRLRHQPDAG